MVLPARQNRHRPPGSRRRRRIINACCAVAAMNVLAWVRGGYGLVLLLSPAKVVAVYSGLSRRPARPIDVRVARVLGVRQIVQAIGCAGAPTRTVWLLGAEVDVAHMLSMLALGACDRTRRREGLADALAAGLFAASSAALAGRASARRPSYPNTAWSALRRVRDHAGAALAQRLLPLCILRGGDRVDAVSRAAGADVSQT